MVLMVVKHKVGMNFVGKDGDAMGLADVAETGKFFYCPFTSDRVVRVTEDKELGVRLSGETLEVFEVDFEMSVIVDEVIAFESASILSNDIEERWIYRWLNNDAVAW